MEFEWDDAKNRANQAKHGVVFEAAAGLDWDSARVVQDSRRDYRENRRVALARSRSACMSWSTRSAVRPCGSSAYAKLTSGNNATMPKPLIDKHGEARSLTRAEIRSARPFSEVEPELARALKTRGPQKTPTKVATTIRLDPEVVAFFKARGKGWQSRINDVLRAVVESAR